MVFIESSIFTRQVQELLTDEEYAELQTTMTQHPDAGDLIHGTGGLRKLCWKGRGHGQTWRRAGDLLLAVRGPSDSAAHDVSEVSEGRFEHRGESHIEEVRGEVEWLRSATPFSRNCTHP